MKERKRDRGWCAGGRYICILSKHSIGLSQVSLSSQCSLADLWPLFVHVCLCMCVFRGRRDKLRVRDTRYKRKSVCEQRRRAASKQHRCCIPSISQPPSSLPISAIFHPSSLPLSFASLLSSPSLSHHPALHLALLALPLHCSVPGCKAFSGGWV